MFGGNGLLFDFHLLVIETDVNVIVIALFLAVGAPIAARRVRGCTCGLDVGLVRNLFGRADSKRGRFRAFLLSCLDSFLKNAKRGARAKRRWPSGGIIAIEDLLRGQDTPFEPTDDDTPERIFNRVWVSELLLRVASTLELE